MRANSGLFHTSPTLKSFFSAKVGGKYRKQAHDLEKKLLESIRKRAASGQNSFKSINSLIMRFPQFKEGLRHIKTIFEQYDEDSNGTIDHKELKKCLSDLQVHAPDEEITAVYHYCDVNEKEEIQFNQFILLLCLIYLLTEPASADENVLGNGPTLLEVTFDTIAEAFSFMDKDGNGKLRRKEVLMELDGASHGEKSPVPITTKRFKELDWNKDGKVSFKEFVFALTKWVGFDSDDEEESQ